MSVFVPIDKYVNIAYFFVYFTQVLGSYVHHVCLSILQSETIQGTQVLLVDDSFNTAVSQLNLDRVMCCRYRYTFTKCGNTYFSLRSLLKLYYPRVRNTYYYRQYVLVVVHFTWSTLVLLLVRNLRSNLILYSETNILT